MRMKAIVSGIAGLPALIAMSPAWAHLDPIEHGSGSAGHAFGADHVLATIVLLAVIGGIAVVVWRSRRGAAESTVKQRRSPK